MSTLPSPSFEQNSCLSEDDVLAFQLGETTPSERQSIHRHIDACDACRQLLLVAAALEGQDGSLGAELDSTERFAAELSSGLRMTTFARGKLLARRFEVTRFVERGGMGEVYEAFDAVVGARVALKTLLCTAEKAEAGANRLGEEVKLARRIAHANVCRIHDLHEHRELQQPVLRFLAMEFVDGVTLKEHLRGGLMGVAEACSIARQLLLGLGAIHAAGVLHLDFKSQNVMLRSNYSPTRAVVMDFSLSRAFEEELHLRTSERHVAGSIGYMSPEQLECRPTLGPAADVYAFGVVFYEMLTGQMPFQADSPAAIMLKQLKSRAPAPSRSRPEVPAALDEFVLTCLSRQSRSRFQSAASALDALEACLRTRAAERKRGKVVWLRTLGVAALTALLTGTLVHLAPRFTLTQELASAGKAATSSPIEPAPAQPTDARDRTPAATDRAALPRPGAASATPSALQTATQALRAPEHSRPQERRARAAAGAAQRSTPAQQPAPSQRPEPAPAREPPATSPAAPTPGWVPQSAPNFLL